MSPRPRKIGDAELVQTATDVVNRLGTEHTRLADVAAASGLAPATLVQRFGSREGLYQAIALAFTGSVRAVFEATGAIGLERLDLGLSRLDGTAQLRFFAGRPTHADAYSLELRKQIGYALSEAIEMGELARCDIAPQARRIQLAYFGALYAAVLEDRQITAADIAALVRDSLAGYV